MRRFRWPKLFSGAEPTFSVDFQGPAVLGPLLDGFFGVPIGDGDIPTTAPPGPADVFVYLGAVVPTAPVRARATRRCRTVTGSSRAACPVWA